MLCDLKITTESPEMAMIIINVMTEMERAEILHPVWPECNVKRSAIILEEAGELIREANLLDEGKGDVMDLKNEIIHCAATCLRMLKELCKEDL